MFQELTAEMPSTSQWATGLKPSSSNVSKSAPSTRSSVASMAAMLGGSLPLTPIVVPARSSRLSIGGAGELQVELRRGETLGGEPGTGRKSAGHGKGDAHPAAETAPDGKVCFGGLERGFYVVRVEGGQDGFHVVDVSVPAAPVVTGGLVFVNAADVAVGMGGWLIGDGATAGIIERSRQVAAAVSL